MSLTRTCARSARAVARSGAKAHRCGWVIACTETPTACLRTKSWNRLSTAHLRRQGAKMRGEDRGVLVRLEAGGEVHAGAAAPVQLAQHDDVGRSLGAGAAGGALGGDAG